MDYIIFKVGNLAFQTYYYLMIIYVITSWLPDLRDNKIFVLISRCVEPYFSLFRRFIPPIGFIDISALIAIVVYQICGRFALEGLYKVLMYFN